MHIETIALANYKSFLDSGVIQLGPGFNVIIGRNNVGKTALLQAASLRYANYPHRSIKTMPTIGSKPKPDSQVVIHIHLEPGEAAQLLMDSSDVFAIPVATNSSQEHATARAEHFLESLQSPDTFVGLYDSNRGFISGSTYLNSLGNVQSSTYAVLSVDREKHCLINQGLGGASDQYNIVLANALHSRLYFFNAERFNVGVSTFGTNTTLQSNASNLAEVLHNLMARKNRFELLNKYVREIFPEIGWVSSPSGPTNNQVQILIYPTGEEALDREDLAISLTDSGTGIGQVLAMLYVVLTAEQSRTIIIDEPQSFLNPGAARKLIEILKQHRQHQFIVSTHNPEIIGAATPTKLLLVRKEGAESVVDSLDPRATEEQTLVLAEVGARLSDVFGADSILWVEGATEEKCYPIIVEKVIGQSLLGTKIIGVVQTGDFEGRFSERVLQIYERLSRGNALVPSALAFLFDREGKTEKQREDLERRTKSKVKFLPRRMYENYLIHPQAIAEVISPLSTQGPIASADIEQWLAQHKSDQAYFSRELPYFERSDHFWEREVDGSRVLNAIFSAFGGPGVYYDKVTHGKALTDWLADHEPTALQEVGNLISELLEAKP